jgi:hypothetical protein
VLTLCTHFVRGTKQHHLSLLHWPQRGNFSFGPSAQYSHNAELVCAESLFTLKKSVSAQG